MKLAARVSGGDHEMLKMLVALRRAEIEPERLRAEAVRLEADRVSF